MKCVISVLGADRTGIVAAVATVLTECDANIDDINQTILGENEIFCMTLLATLNITIQREDVFRFMHEI